MNVRLPVGASASLRWALVAAGAAALLAFVWILVPPLVNSDSAAVVLLADELVKSGRWLSPDWFYVSDSLMFDGSVHAAKIGVLLFGATTDAARFTAGIGALLASLAGYWLARTLSASRADAWIASFALLLGPSLIYQDLMIGLPATFQVALVLALLACAIRFCLQNGSAWHLALACSLALLLSFSVPKKALVYVLLPIIGGIASQWILCRNGGGTANDSRRSWCLLALSLAAWAIGDWMHSRFLQGLVVSTRYARMSIVPEPGHVLHNLETILALGWKFAGGENGLFAGVLAALAIAGWACLVAAPIASRESRRSMRGARGFAYCFALAGTLAIFAYLLLYEQIRIYYGIYYAMATIPPLFALAAGNSREAHKALHARVARGTLAGLLVLGIATTAMACMKFPEGYFGISKNQRSTSAEREQAVDWLVANGIRHGFADYWDANAMTLVSGGEVQVGSFHVLPRKGRTSRHAWLSTRERTNYVPGRGQWFIAINARRRALKLTTECLPASRVATIASYRIYVYDRPMPGCLAAPVSPRRGS